MKTCAVCEKPLPTPLDEYGPAEKPVCQRCFFEPPELTKDIQDAIQDLEDEIEDLQGEVDILQDQIQEKEREIDDLQTGKIRPEKDEKERLRAWKLGLAKVVVP